MFHDLPLPNWPAENRSHVFFLEAAVFQNRQCWIKDTQNRVQIFWDLKKDFCGRPHIVCLCAYNIISPEYNNAGQIVNNHCGPCRQCISNCQVQWTKHCIQQRRIVMIVQFWNGVEASRYGNAKNNNIAEQPSCKHVAEMDWYDCHAIWFHQLLDRKHPHPAE